MLCDLICLVEDADSFHLERWLPFVPVEGMILRQIVNSRFFDEWRVERLVYDCKKDVLSVNIRLQSDGWRPEEVSELLDMFF